MKKRNLFLTLVFVALAVMVGIGSMFTTFVQAQNMALQVAAAEETTGTKLFDNNGNYAVERNSLTKGKIYNFFGLDWYLVNLNDKAEVATFWLVQPYGSDVKGATSSQYRYAFNKQIASGDRNDNTLFSTGNTLWRNGYSQSIWTNNDNKELGESQLRASLRTIAETIIDQDSYKNYKDRVVPGYVADSNMDNNNAKLTLGQGSVYYSANSLTSIDIEDEEKKDQRQTMAVYYTLDESDRIWLPAVEEVRDNGFWRLTKTERNFTNTTIDNAVWLRTAVDNNSTKAHLVGAETTIYDGDTPVTQEQGFYKDVVDQEHGVRPAIHLSLKNYTGTSDSGKGGWFTDDMMKVFFIIICVLGVIGIILVITAVVIKARRDKNANA